ncbi:ABC transporter ATP-binding protein [Veronia nyctiphanis]|uniref:ABC transporter ATP-binding protein n=1 Tax=Veronia nyctiphanis TaxID=1278244 RepID=A0A4Q0YLF0_9GAMM|nr:ABC transporter ATP-binding protein [Veronia nyctiphanis]RXJ70834.1 ABC transporter ATP-binding protein [Veronia nyctiphanis]
MKNVIELKNISKVFKTEDIATQALNNINLTVKEGEFVAITGTSGCGKSTLLSILGLIDTPTGGEYFISDKPSTDLSSDQRAFVRANHLGFIFQAFNLISDLTVLENVILPLTYQGGIKREEMLARGKKVLEQVNLLNRCDHYPAQLSGGQQQRAAVARALINEPDLILADEPTGNLDSKNARQVLELLKSLHEQGKTICMVTHDMDSTRYASRTLTLSDGAIVNDRQQVLAEVV